MTAAQLFLVLVVAIPLVLVSRNRLRADLAGLSIAVVLALGQLLGLGLLWAPSILPRTTSRRFPVLVSQWS